MTDLILALDHAGFNIMDLLMSKTAIIMYDAVLAVLLIALMISLLRHLTSKTVSATTQNLSIGLVYWQSVVS